MRIARFAAGGEPRFGLIQGNPQHRGEATVVPLAGHPFAGLSPEGPPVPLDGLRLLAPILPSKVIAVAKNYSAHAREMGDEVPPSPVVFLKPSTAVIGPGEAIQYPPQSSEVHHEAELAVVIGRLCRDVPSARAAEVILGYTVANDVTARDLQRSDGQWGRAKGFDTFCPIGPWIETDLDPSDLAVSCRVNGQVRQDGRTSQMVFDVAALVEFVSAAMTLLPGDVILTGTPAGVGPIAIGDEVTVSVEGIGTLANRVVARG